MKITGTHKWTYEGEVVVVEGEVDYTIIPGCRGCRTMRNGDPGWPDDPPEVEFSNPVVTKITAEGEELKIYTPARGWFDKCDQEALMDHLCLDHMDPPEPEYEPELEPEYGD
jgi:hypothetical protein